MDLPAGASTVTLPDNDNIKILAMTVARGTNDDTVAAHWLYDNIAGVRVEPQGGLHIDPVRVSLRTTLPDARIVYTLDGSEPDRDSALYAGALEISDTTTVSARVLRGGVLEDYVTRTTFTFTEARAPEQPPGVVKGLNYRYFEGSWRNLPNFDELTPVRSGSIASFDLSPRQTREHYGFAFIGYVEISLEGIYTFFTSSDDGSKLHIGDVEVVDNDGLHGQVERSGKIALEPGLHAIRVTFFERGGDDELVVSYEGPGVSKRPIPPAILHRTPTSTP
jgi:hypothetical protein